MHPIRTMRSYVQAIPSFITYQVVSRALLLAVGALFNELAFNMMVSHGHVAVTTGDFGFLFTTWWGIAMVVLAVTIAYLYVGFDVGAKVAFAGRWVKGEDVSMREVLKDGVLSLKKLFSPLGFVAVFYIAVLAPLVGFEFTISLTSGLKIPTFISSVIYATPLYHAAYLVVLIILTAVGFINLFLIHGVVLDNLSMRDAGRRSFMFMRRHWLDYFLQMFGFIVLEALAIVLIAAVLVAVGTSIAIWFIDQDWTEVQQAFGGDLTFDRFVTLFACMQIAIFIALVELTTTPFLFIKLTKLYEQYKTGQPVEIPKRPHRLHPFLALGLVVTEVLSLAIAYAGAMDFDELFPQESKVQVIAHRACGNEGYENTVEGLAVAEASGAWGAEIDIQRTSDGAYVVNHDDNFLRVAGESRKPSQMTLAEVKQLRVTANPANPDAEGVPVSTYEEMLDGAREHNLVLFVELKGETADHQMADDAVRIAQERGMLDQCVFISLKYDLIDYLEHEYDDIKCGFLAFGSYGGTEYLNCDYLALEELVTNPGLIETVHETGKGYLVWTVNTKDEQEKYLCMPADAIITDNMTQAAQVKKELGERDDFSRITAIFSQWF